MAEHLAIAPGFFGGRRIGKGEKFSAPDSFKARWATPAAGITSDEVEAIQNPIAVFLAQKTTEIAAGIADKPLAELRQILDAEAAGARRKAVMARLTDAIATREANPADGEADGEDDALLS